MEEERQTRTLYIGGLDFNVTEELLYELFLQAGPLESVKIPKKDGSSRGFAFVTFRHDVSVPYSIDLFRGLRLYGRYLVMKSKAPPGYVPQSPSSAGSSPARETPNFHPPMNRSASFPAGLDNMHRNRNRPDREMAEPRTNEQSRERPHGSTNYDRKRKSNDSDSEALFRRNVSVNDNRAPTQLLPPYNPNYGDIQNALNFVQQNLLHVNQGFPFMAPRLPFPPSQQFSSRPHESDRNDRERSHRHRHRHHPRR